MKPPLISVVMSVFNGERWLNEAVKSVLLQDFPHFEFIIVNDGSTDRSPTLLRQLAAEDPRILLIDKPNSGLSDSLNLGIQHARGTWIARLDADDICHPSRLSEQIQLVVSDRSVVLIGSGLWTIDANGRAGKEYRYPEKHAALKRRLLRNGAFFAHSSAFYSAESVRAVGGYRVRMKRSQDFDLWLRLSEVGKMRCIRRPLIKIRHHPDQISHDEGGIRQNEDAFMALVSYWIRHMQGSDPLALPESEYNLFRNWLLRELTQTDFYDRIRLKQKVLARWRGTRPPQTVLQTKGALDTLKLIASASYTHYLGSQLPKLFASKWLCETA